MVAVKEGEEVSKQAQNRCSIPHMADTEAAKEVMEGAGLGVAVAGGSEEGGCKAPGTMLSVKKTLESQVWIPALPVANATLYQDGRTLQSKACVVNKARNDQGHAVLHYHCT